MPVNKENYLQIKEELGDAVDLVAVSKTKPTEDILELYTMGQRDFGENYVQELETKQAQLPKDIRWHFIGHLQTNKVKYIAPFVYLVQGVDSFKLLKEIDRQAAKCSRVVDVLLQVHIAQEETKFGMNAAELDQAVRDSLSLQHVLVRGLMGMASLTTDGDKVKKEFQHLKSLFDKYAELQTPNSELRTPAFSILSMGMSDDYALAIGAGSNMVRIGSRLFGARNY